METTNNPILYIDSPLPSLKFQIPIQGNHQETMSPTLPISNLHIQLNCNTMHYHVSNDEIDPNSPFRVDLDVETNVQSPIYLRNDSVERDMINELSKAKIPTIHHEYIIHSTLAQVNTIIDDFDVLFVTPLLLLVEVTCHVYYFTNMNVVSGSGTMRLQENQIDDEESFEDYSGDDESDEDDDDRNQENLTDDDEYDYWLPEFDEIGDHMIPASDSSIKSLVVMRKMKRGEIDEEEEGSSCSICLDEFLEGSVTGCMPCLHMFHEECITNWLRKSHYCPLCRFEMPTTVYN